MLVRVWSFQFLLGRSYTTRLSLEQLIRFVVILANYTYSSKKFETPKLLQRVQRFVRQLELGKHKIVKKRLFDAYRDRHKLVKLKDVVADRWTLSEI